MFNEKFHKLQGDNFVDGKPYCIHCGEPRFWESPDKTMLVRAICRCQNEKLEAIEREKELKNGYLSKRFSKKEIKVISELDILGERYENNYFGIADTDRPQDFLDALDKSKQWLSNYLDKRKKKTSVLFHGQVGRGKTFLASCLHNELKRNDISILFTSISKIISYILSSFNDDGLATRIFVENLLTRIEVLFLDDFGTEQIKSENTFAHELVYNIINNRYINNKPIIYTTNLSAFDLKQKYEPKIIDRFSEIPLKLELKEGESYRKEIFKKGYE